ncbi:MAG TPA: hypothetical protein VHE30_26900 [Polyangiaceae bacterium]|nr:hypothetical protein [Polyangiaceae bacterium]
MASESVSTRAGSGGLILLGAALAGCSLAIDADRVQCKTNADCTSRGASFAHSACVASLCQAIHAEVPEPKVDAGGSAAAPADAGLDPWRCLDEPEQPTTDAPGPFHVTFHLSDILSQTPQVGVTARACKKLDVDCELPQSDSLVTDENGDVTLDLARGFNGYVEFTGGAIMPGLYFPNPPVHEDESRISVQAVTPGIVGALTKSLGSPQDPALGLMLLNALTCDGTGAPHVSYTATGTAAGAVTFYAIGGLPAANAIETDSSGFGGFVNVPPGTVPVTATILPEGRELATVSLLVRANTITYGHLVPLGQ